MWRILCLGMKGTHFRQYNELLQLVQELYKLGFRVISHEANMVVGPRKDGYYNNIEVVFMKQ